MREFSTHIAARDDAGHAAHVQVRFGDGPPLPRPDRSDEPYRIHSARELDGLNQCVCVALHDVNAQCPAAPANTAFAIRSGMFGFDNYWGEQ